MMAMAGMRMYEVDHLSFVRSATLAVVVRKGCGATLVQLLTVRLKIVPSLDDRDCRVGGRRRAGADLTTAKATLQGVEGADEDNLCADEEVDNEASRPSLLRAAREEGQGQAMRNGVDAEKGER
jgi:hypothetical protein